jgi:hypothetical protein
MSGGSTPVKGAVLGALALIALALGLTLNHSPARVAGSDGVLVNDRLASTTSSGIVACQAGETVPASTTAIRLSLDTVVGPTVAVTASAAGATITSGTRSSGWGAWEVTVPVSSVAHTTTGARVCFKLGQLRGQSLTILGQRTRAAIAATGAGQPLAGRMRIDYLAPGAEPWSSHIHGIIRRIGLGRAWAGAWIAWLVLALMLAITALTSWWTVRALSAAGRSAGAGTARGWRRIPPGARVCALLAFLSATCWSFISAPFQLVDEPDHFAYVQRLAESAQLPRGNVAPIYSREQETALADLHYLTVRRQPQHDTISTAAEQRLLERDLSSGAARTTDGYAGNATPEPPLYYALLTIPYKLAASGTLLDRLALIRLLSALMAAITGAFAFLFVAEALPGAPWAWTVGGVGVALQPVLGMMSGAVNPDALLFAVCAVLFYLLARGFRRGLTRRLAIAIVATCAAGYLTKLTFLGLLPGALLGLVLLSTRRARSERRPALALSAVTVPILLCLLLGAALGRSGFAALIDTLHIPGSRGGSLPAQIAYTWDLYLPRLPGLPDDFPGVLTTRAIWLNGLTGLYGWIDTTFPGWVYDAALAPIGLVIGLCVRALVSERDALRARLAELLTYCTIGLGVMVLVAGASYTFFLNQAGPYQQIRYMFPMLALLAAVLALAARGAGRRWGPFAGASIVMLILAHEIFSQLLVVSRYYG